MSKTIQRNTLHTIEFVVDKTMVDAFAALIGDYNSAHSDAEFGRRTRYRNTIVHGMLPVSFLSALPEFSKSGSPRWLKELSVRFIKPVYINDQLQIRAQVIKIITKQNHVHWEFVIHNIKSGVVVTSGEMIIQNGIPSEKGLKVGKRKRKKIHAVLGSVLSEPVSEKSWQFDQIVKGAKDRVRFSISRNSISTFNKILNSKASVSPKINFLSSCLFSTFAGMCIPGQFGALVSVSLEFIRPLNLDTGYALKGSVIFKSQSTSSIVESMVIEDEATGAICSEGKITAVVNPPFVQMPRIQDFPKITPHSELRNKVVLITGASRGIGETTAKLFSLHGAKVIVNYFHGQKDAKEIVEEIKENGGDAIAIGADISDKAQVSKMITTAVKKYGTIHILVNNAVRDANPTPFLEMIWDDFQKDIDVAVKGAVNCCQAVIPWMLKNKWGRIVNVSTIFTTTPPPQQTKYIVAKSGLEGLTKSLAVEFASHNILVHMVTPVRTWTDLSSTGSRQESCAVTPLDIAQAIVARTVSEVSKTDPRVLSPHDF